MSDYSMETSYITCSSYIHVYSYNMLRLVDFYCIAIPLYSTFCSFQSKYKKQECMQFMMNMTAVISLVL